MRQGASDALVHCDVAHFAGSNSGHGDLNLNLLAPPLAFDGDWVEASCCSGGDSEAADLPRDGGF